MIGFYSKLLGVEYPWPKYAQMVGYDYVSGAMENTTATLHSSAAYRSSRELADGNNWESVVAHELFHQWFGDLVTAESWSNLTVNESFADYSELLWQEYKYGKDAAAALNYNSAQGYLANRQSATRNLVRFQYADKEDMFDGVSYTKGGRILHMLRTYLGDSVFFKGLNIYLTTNRFKNGEGQQLRLALEEASGRDLNWFFNQWYYGAGHPDVTLSYAWSDSAQREKLTVVQHQANLFTFPLHLEVYGGAQPTMETVWVSNADSVSTFYLNTGGSAPRFINVDVEKAMLWRKADQKPNDWWLAQYDHANNYVDKIEVLNWLATHFDSSDAQRAIYAKALSDGYYGIRNQAMAFYNRNPQLITPAEEAVLYSMAQQYGNQPCRASAISLLGKKYGSKYSALYRAAVNDSSYTVAGAALEGIIITDMAAAKALQPQLSKDAKGRLLTSLNIVTYSNKTEADADSVLATFRRTSFFEKLNLIKPIAYYLVNVKDVATFKKIAGPVLELSTNRMGAMFSGAGSSNPIRALLTDNFNWLIQKKEAALAANPNDTNLREQIKYITDKMVATQ
jgi:aminopeptidase N